MTPSIPRFPAGRRATALLAPALALLIAACAPTLRTLPPGETAAMETVRELYADGEFGESVLAAREFLEDHPGSRYLDEARFLLARSLYEEGDFLEAEEQLRRLQRDFPESPFAEEGMYYLGLALLSQARGPQLDQEETIAAQVQFRSFINRFPDSPLRERAEMHIANIRARLAEKQYLNGMVYFRARAHRAARFYFEEKVYREFPETEWAAKALLRLAEIAEREEDWSTAAEWCGRLLADYPESEPAKEGRELLDEATRRIEEAPAGEESAAEVPSPDPER